MDILQSFHWVNLRLTLWPSPRRATPLGGGTIVEGEKKAKEKKAKKANAIRNFSSQLFNEIDGILWRHQKGKFLNDQGKKSEEQQPNMSPCPHCGRKGHEESMC